MNIPILRFPEFKNEWQLKNIGILTNRLLNPVKVQSHELYKQIGIRSHGKGIFYKDEVTGKELGNKRVFWVKADAFIVNIVFAWEQAVAKTTEKEIGMVASHRFPMYAPVETQSNLDYLLHFFLTPKGKTLLELASPGGAGRNKTLGQKEFEKLKFLIPNLEEQMKIATFLTAIDNKLNQLKQKKTLLEQYKKGVMQKIFSQEIRFKDDANSYYLAWEEIDLANISKIEKGVQFNKEDLFSVGQYPCINGGVEPSGYSDKYNREKNTITISEGGNSCGFVNFIETQFWCGGHCYTVEPIIRIDKSYLFQLLKYYESGIMSLRVGSGLPNIQKKDILRFKVMVSTSIQEQAQIANFLSALDKKINHCQKQIEQTEVWKKGLLQKMFC